MRELSTLISKSFSANFQDFLSRVQGFATELTEEEFWGNPFPYGNSIGHLVLHLTGNLNHYIGAELAASGYVRNRNLEFTETQFMSKTQAVQALATAVEMVVAVLNQQEEQSWSQPYSADGVDDVHDRFSIFLRCAIHFHHHIGHMSYTYDEHLYRRHKE